MRPPSEYIAPFDEDRQTGLVQTLPAGGIVAVGVGLAVAVGTVALEDAVGGWEVEAEPDDEAEAEWLAEPDDEAEAEWLAEPDDEAEAEWLAEPDDEAEAAVEAVLEVDADGGLVAVAEADPLVVPPVGADVTPSLSTVKVARRLEVLPPRQVKTTLIVCDPSTSFVVSYERAEPSLAVPARSNGGTHSVRVGVLLRHPPSR
jgi:hypothetical protein